MSQPGGPAWLGLAYPPQAKIDDRVPGQPNNYREKMAMYGNHDPEFKTKAPSPANKAKSTTEQMGDGQNIGDAKAKEEKNVVNEGSSPVAP
ncbi:MAG: hypothetical protein Q9191_005528 [Dirinaria sp. TL-2023a]